MPVQTIQELYSELDHKRRSLSDLRTKISQEGRNFTPSEKEEQDTLDKEMAALQVDIKEREETEERLNRIAVQEEELRKPRETASPSEDGDPGLVPLARREDLPAVYRRHGKLKAFVNADGTPDERGAYRMGMWLAASLGNESAHRFCMRNDIVVNTRAMSEHINTAGGALVPDELGSRIIDLREEHGAFRRNTYIEPMASDTKSITRQTGGMTAYFVGEGDDHTESDMSFDTIKLVVKKLVAATRISSELEEDAIISVADRFAMDAAKALALKEDQCGFNGDGAQTFAGIFGVCNKMEANTGFAGVYTLSPIDSFAEVDNTHIATVMAALPGYVLNPKWYVSSAGWAMVFQRLAIAANGNTLSQLQGGPITRSYLGYPIELVQVMTTSLTATGTNGKTMFMFGDLAEASTLGDRRGLTLKRSDEKYWSSDEIAMKATERFDINVHDIGDATDAGPLVGMVGLT